MATRKTWLLTTTHENRRAVELETIEPFFIAISQVTKFIIYLFFPTYTYLLLRRYNGFVDIRHPSQDGGNDNNVQPSRWAIFKLKVVV
jgi:hypothetical protein